MLIVLMRVFLRLSLPALLLCAGVLLCGRIAGVTFVMRWWCLMCCSVVRSAGMIMRRRGWHGGVMEWDRINVVT